MATVSERKERLAELDAELERFRQQEEQAELERQRRQEVADERGRLLDEAAEEQRAKERQRTEKAAGKLQAAQLEALAEAGRLVGELDQVWRGMVERAQELAAIRARSGPLFDSRSEHKLATGEPLELFPPDLASFLAVLADAACSEQIRRAELLPAVWLASTPDLTGSPRGVTVSETTPVASRLI